MTYSKILHRCQCGHTTEIDISSLLVDHDLKIMRFIHTRMNDNQEEGGVPLEETDIDDLQILMDMLER